MYLFVKLCVKESGVGPHTVKTDHARSPHAVQCVQFEHMVLVVCIFLVFLVISAVELGC